MSAAPSASVAGMAPLARLFSQTSRVNSVATGACVPVPVVIVIVENRELSSPSHAKNTKVSVPGLSAT